MKKINNCEVENCIPTLSSCVEWNGGDIESLGVCAGESINLIIWEILNKLENIAGDDLSKFDIDSLIEVCNSKSPDSTSLISILNLLKQNDICLKDYINVLSEKINEISTDSNVSVNLKCFADIDNLGNVLSISRDQLDQLVIDQLCSIKSNIDSINGSIITIKSDIDSIKQTIDTSDEVSTCINPSYLSLPEQIKNTSTALCDLVSSTGTPSEIDAARIEINHTNAIKTGGNGFTLDPTNLADHYLNLILEFNRLLARVSIIENTCCKTDCSSLLIDFNATFDSDSSEVTLDFSPSTIPNGFFDNGTSITITDKNGVSVNYTTNGITIPYIVTYTGSYPNRIQTINSLTLSIDGLASGKLFVSFKNNFVFKNEEDEEILTCSDCSGKDINYVNSACCTITNVGEDVVTLTVRTCSS